MHQSGVVYLCYCVYQIEVVSKLSVHALSTVPHDAEPAALLWAAQPKRGNNDMAASLHGSPHRLHIAMPLVGLCEKVKYGSIMPHVIEVGVKLCLGDV